MGILEVPQIASRDAGAWVGSATVDITGMTITIGGSATLPTLTDGQPDPTKPRVTTPLSAAIPVAAPASGTQRNLIAIGWDGTVYLNPPTSQALAAYLAWMDVPAGTTDLGAITVNVLQQSEVA